MSAAEVTLDLPDDSRPVADVCWVCRHWLLPSGERGGPLLGVLEQRMQREGWRIRGYECPACRRYMQASIERTPWIALD